MPATTDEVLARIVSWAVGMCFDRWPRNDPSSRQEEQVDTAAMVYAARPAVEPEEATDAILVDDEGHERDIVLKIREVLEDIDGGRWLQAIEDAGIDLRAWLRRSFFSDHVSRYSYARRVAPIYWQLASVSGAYSVWLYYPRTDRDSLYKVVREYVDPKLHHEERKLAEILEEGGNVTAARRRSSEREAVLTELRAFRDCLSARVAPLWSPDLNDGAVVNCAPLWPLVSHHRSWQRQCRENWQKLGAGEYDWAHLAMHLWPECVVPKCAESHSLAIAHGLEDVFWFEDEDGKWHPRAEPTQDVDDLIRERSSSAVKDALGAVA